MTRRLLLASLLALSLSACGGSDTSDGGGGGGGSGGSGGPGGLDLTGGWTGSYTSNTGRGTGTVDLSVVQDAQGEVTGSGTIEGIGFVDLDSTYNAQQGWHGVLRGGTDLSFQLSTDGTQATGTYDTADGDDGTVSLTKS